MLPIHFVPINLISILFSLTLLLLLQSACITIAICSFCKVNEGGRKLSCRCEMIRMRRFPGYHPVASLLLTESDGAAFWPRVHFDEGESEKFNSATLMKKVRVKSLSWMKGGAHHRIKTFPPSTIELTSWQLRPSSS